ncbi:MAG: SSS family solute:Na+ symporter [Rubritalea sp.]|jgi:SSS family solute:Na+ symporter
MVSRLWAMEKVRVEDFFMWQDWAVIAGYLILTTIVGHAMRGKQGTIKDFFLGGKSLPWQAVSGSIIATEISGVTFIGVAGGLFAIHGDFTYLLWGIGSIMGRVIVAKWFVPRFYEEEIYSPYDYMGRRIGLGAKKLATVIFTIGSILGQSVRVFVAAIPLKVVTGMDIQYCIVIIGLFAIGWTLMGGMRTVIWTDVMQFVLFAFGGLLTLYWIISSMNGGWGEMWATAENFGRNKTWDARFGFGKELEFTLWVAILAVPFQNLTAFGVDQLNAQRMFCCKDKKSAQKALVWSSVGQLMTLMMLLVGASLVVHYDKNPFTPKEGIVVMGIDDKDDAVALQKAEKALADAPRIEHVDVVAARAKFITANPDDPKATQFSDPQISSVAVVSKPDNVFPMWIVMVLPVGLSGLILAGVFAAAISSLDSILAALSQTTLSLFYDPENKTEKELEELDLMTKSRQLVVMWGVILTLFTIGLSEVAQGIPVLPLAFGMTTYTMGPMLAIFFCAMLGRGSVRGLLIGFIISFCIATFMRMDFWVLLKKSGISIDWLARLPTYTMEGDSVTLIYLYAWLWPLTTIITFACGVLIPKKEKKTLG